MTLNETYIYLGTVRSLRKQEIKLREHIDDLMTRLLPSGIRYDKEKVQTSPDDKMLEIFADLDDAERELEYTLRKICEARVAITAKTYILPVKERQVLLRYYVDIWSIRKISNELKVTERHAYRLRNNGISMLQKISELGECDDKTINNNSML